MIDEKNFSDQPVENGIRTYNNNLKIRTSQGDNYATSCLLDYLYFKEHYKMIAIDLSKQQALDADATQCNSVNIKLSISQLNKLKSGIKNGTEVTLNLSSYVISGSNEWNNFPHKLLLTDRDKFQGFIKL